MKVNSARLKAFQITVWGHYHTYGRNLPWRKNINPYRILVSEIMLQQTQVTRVLTKYQHFIDCFPDFRSLSQAPLKNILQLWSGMGYNRRALYLRKIAIIVMEQYGGILPLTIPELDALPGIGEATAASIAVFAYNFPAVFIETNIRRAFIHHFFGDRNGIEDKEILPLVEKTLETDNPRDWYYALMDYGTHLAKTVANPNRKSKHYIVQARYEGSDRQIRGKILRILLADPVREAKMRKLLGIDETRVKNILQEMAQEGLIMKRNGVYAVV